MTCSEIGIFLFNKKQVCMTLICLYFNFYTSLKTYFVHFSLVNSSSPTNSQICILPPHLPIFPSYHTSKAPSKWLTASLPLPTHGLTTASLLFPSIISLNDFPPRISSTFCNTGPSLLLLQSPSLISYPALVAVSKSSYSQIFAFIPTP